MRRIAFAAVSFAMLATAASTQVASADTKSKTVSNPKPAPLMVTVQAGDTLSSIASQHQTTYVRIFDVNPTISNPDIIDVGQQVRIPDASEQLTDRQLPTQAIASSYVTPTTGTATASTYRATISAAATPVVPGSGKALIYGRESGNNPNSTNPAGCYGLGQDCNGRVKAQCGADYGCQDAYFTSYANSRYGGWDNAASFWRTHGWW